MNRRQFGLYAFSLVGLAGLGLGKFYEQKVYLRPPGSVKNFESLCVKCGQCVQVCPYESIGLLANSDVFNLGSAYIDASKKGCYLCDLLPCVLACPSGALDHSTTHENVSMGVAVVKQINDCYANLAKTLNENDLKPLLKTPKNDMQKEAQNKIKENEDEICSLCVRCCPVNGAIELVKLGDNILPKIESNCVGCGVCQEVCLAKIIEIIPNKTYDEIYKGQ